MFSRQKRLGLLRGLADGTYKTQKEAAKAGQVSTATVHKWVRQQKAVGPQVKPEIKASPVKVSRDIEAENRRLKAAVKALCSVIEQTG